MCSKVRRGARTRQTNLLTSRGDSKSPTWHSLCISRCTLAASTKRPEQLPHKATGQCFKVKLLSGRCRRIRNNEPSEPWDGAAS